MRKDNLLDSERVVLREREEEAQEKCLLEFPFLYDEDMEEKIVEPDEATVNAYLDTYGYLKRNGFKVLIDVIQSDYINKFNTLPNGHSKSDMEIDIELENNYQEQLDMAIDGWG